MAVAAQEAPASSICIGVLDRFEPSYSQDHGEWSFVPVLNYREAFETVYTDDRHFTPYVVTDGDMPNDLSVRLKKHGKYNLEFIEKEGHTVLLNLIVLDIDQEFDVSVLPEYWGWYKTKNGIRLFAELARPLPPHWYEAQVQQAYRDIPQADPRCRDWTRLYRMPNVTRCDDKTDNKPVKLRSAVHFPTGKLPVVFEPIKIPRPSLPAPDFDPECVYEGHTADERIDKATQWVTDEAPEAVAGSNGDLETFRVAQKILRAFYLSPDQAFDVMVYWNALKAKPPWTTERLKYKIEQALTEGQTHWGIAYWNPGWKDGDPEPTPHTPSVEPTTEPKLKATKKKKNRGRLEFPVTTEKGVPIPCIENTEALLTHYGVVPAYNLMTHEDELFIPDFDGAADKRNNVGLATVKEWFRRRKLDLEPLHDHLTILFAQNSYHPVADWIREKAWDKVDRLGALMNTLEFKDKSLEYRLRMERMFVAWACTAARAATISSDALEGVATQLVMCLQGDQGVYKTRWCMSLVPKNTGWAREGILLNPNSRDSVKQATNVWLGELGELDATFKKADIAALKAFITNRTDTYRSPYARLDETVARRTVYLATVNEGGFLHDDTGSRRFATMALIGCNPDHDIDMQQFWAQMLELVETEPERQFLSKEDERLLIEANKGHEVIDPMTEWLFQCWEPDPEHKQYWKLQDILKGIDHERSWNTADGRAVAKGLRNKMKAHEKTTNGYTVFAVKRTQGNEPFQIGKGKPENENEKQKSSQTP